MYAQDLCDLRLLEVTPASGNEISVNEDGNLDIVLHFDLSDVIAVHGESDQYGIGLSGNNIDYGLPNEIGTYLFLGTYEEGVFLQKVNAKTITGRTATFKTGDTFAFSFPSLGILPGQIYTVVIRNPFSVYRVGESRVLARLDYKETPLVLTYVGKSVETGVVLESCSVAQNTELESLGIVRYRFNNEVEVVDGAVAKMMEGETLVAERPLTVLASDGKEVTVDFSGDMAYNSRKYSLVLPAGSLRLKGGDALNTSDLRVDFTGSYVGHFQLVSSVPSDNSTAYPGKITLTFDIPDPADRLRNSGNINYMDVYDSEVSDEAYVCRLDCKDGGISEDGRSMTFEFDKVITPGKKYVFDIPAGRLLVMRNNKYDYGWTNEAVRLTVTAPSVEESGFPAMEFQDPVVGEYGKSTQILTPETTLASLRDGIEIALKDLWYIYENPEAGISIKTSLSLLENKGYLYDITGGTEQLVSETTLFTKAYDTPSYETYSVIRVSRNSSNPLFDGHRYKIVIPAGSYSIIGAKYREYVLNPELSYEFMGAVPEEVAVVECTLPEGAKLSTLGNVIFGFNGKFEFNPEKKAVLTETYVNVAGMEIHNSMSYFMNRNASLGTKIVAFIYNLTTGEPLTLVKDRNYTLKLPAGTMYYAGDPSICNEEYVVSFRGGDPAPVFTEPEYVDLTVTVNGAHTSINKAVKGKTSEVKFTPDEYWTVWRVSRDGNDVTGFVQNGAYTTPALNESTTIEATMAYTGQFMVEQTSGVFTVPGSPVTVRTEEGVIIVEGVTPEDTITVYTVSGMVISNITPELGVVRISVDPGQVYIVRVNQRAAKVRP